MKTSEQTDKVLPAILKAAAEFRPVHFDAANTHFKSKYATLPAYLEAVRPALLANGLFLTQATGGTGPVVIETRVTHAASGQWIASDYPVHPIKSDPQAEGSALTYGRRYALASLLGLAADDDDGNAASAGAQREETAALSDWLAAIKDAGDGDELHRVNVEIKSAFPKGVPTVLVSAWKARAADLKKAA
jgi:hypothetical protein